MPKYVALLRAINVGGHNVKMDRLRAVFSDMGFTRVESFIASGNIIFDTRTKRGTALERKIESGLVAALGYNVATFIRTPSELKAVAEYTPFEPAEMDRDGNLLYVGFCRAPATTEAQERVSAMSTEIDAFHFHGSELYWLRRTAIGASKCSGARIEMALGSPLTTRNANTVRNLAAKYA